MITSRHSNETISKIVELKHKGLSSRAIAEELGISKTSVNETYNRWSQGILTNDYPDGELEYQEIGNQFFRERGPRILFFDLESTPSIVATFGRWKQNIGTESVLREGGYLLSACWKFYGDENVTRMVLTPEEAKAGDDVRIVCGLFEAFEQADIVVAHNAVKFDVPLFKTRLISNNMPPPKAVKVVDTLQIAKTLRFNSNKLDSLGNYLNVGRKIETTGISLWIRCMNGDKEALESMVTYNEQDVVLLENVYKKLRAFDKRPANAGHYYHDEHSRCPVCGSDEVEETGNVVYTAVSSFAEVVCNDCGHRSRTRQALNSKHDRAKLLVPAQ